MLLDATRNMLPEQAPVLQALRILDQAQAKIALVVNAQGKLSGCVVDGDVRRGLLHGHSLETPVSQIMHRQPYVLPAHSSRQKILHAMQVLEIKQVPLVTPEGLVTGIAVHDLLLGLQHGERPNHVVVMAGGKGKRLLPITQDLPKPMVQLGGKPILEWILLRLRHHGFREFSFAINYLGHVIEDYFGDGTAFGCRIRYVREKDFLGTAGALSLLPPGDTHPLVVTNGDILSGIDFGHLVDFHAAGGRSATVCARAHRVEVPYGVIEMHAGCLQGIVEKPVYDNLISAGIYVLSPQVLARIPKDQVLDMPDLLRSLINAHHAIGVFVLEDEWVDVGRHDDLERAKRNFTDPG
ncbi:nucleotidyl transferase [Verminephrobacter aporrectodeae subsp. tuberculatae]|uniref:nucleotidyltransferase family protein n=1 Tax=Verminephrobacter aporrectodeae TaxID=1110389 RepID=UPI0002378574|nr:nucleotidyltransferase family protein [Verminephrobacter aporrectodeae]MCW8164703.1 nucleotidyl transferase [Verminephrobacter aporrectodeae subsp. tuberculatae]MCW8169371.1 nucleotidyl transferase [Verminephrobacter aporrectodeae subsp. tuberculatae]